MDLHTVGFTKHSAADFFGLLKSAGITNLIDVRLRNSSQLSGFAKRDDLRFFLKELCGASYHHEPELAPTTELLDAYQKDGLPWEEYETEFLTLMADRQIQDSIDPVALGRTPVLLCSEHSAERCHRRLVCDYLQDHWSNVRVTHL